MSSESPLPPKLAKELSPIIFDLNPPEIDFMPPPLPKSPNGSSVYGKEAASSRPPSPDMTVSPDMPPLTRTNSKCVITSDLAPSAEPVPLSAKEINRLASSSPPVRELCAIKGYPVPPPQPKFVENHWLGSSEYCIKGRERSATAPLSSDDKENFRKFLLSMAKSTPKETLTSNRKSVSFAEPELADSARSSVDPPPSSPPLSISSLSEQPWLAHCLPKIGTQSPPARKRDSISPSRSPPPPPPPSPSSPNLRIIKQPIPKPYRGQELSVIADLHRDHLPHANHSNCHGTLHLVSVPTKEEFKDHKIVVTLKAGSSIPKGARILVFKFRIMTLGLYRAVVRLNLVHLGNALTQEEVETNEFQV